MLNVSRRDSEHAVSAAFTWWQQQRSSLFQSLLRAEGTLFRLLRAPTIPTVEAPKPDRPCRGCGKTIRNGRSHCAHCTVSLATERLMDATRPG
jgi:hypothetical protein